ncbi:hypothetical protein COOONC_13006 [Cooperia oncophora]
MDLVKWVTCITHALARYVLCDDHMILTVRKNPGELVGSVCLDNGHPRVTEYSELGAELAEKKTPDGRLLFCAGSIANHVFSLDFLESFCEWSFHLPYHRAAKKIAHMTPDGTFVKPTSPNGIKLEQFVFDVFEKSRNFYIWEVEREDEFSPLKNAESVGKECLSTCKRDLASVNRKWLETAGAIIKDDGPVYIDASASYCGEGNPT